MDIKIFEYLQNPKKFTYGIIKLNSKFSNDGDLKLFIKLWEDANIRGCADGGTNFLYNNVESSKASCLPTFISGDFDSIMPHVKEFYGSKGVEIIHTPDQEETDFTKSLRILYNKSAVSNAELDFVVAHVGRSSDRFDHSMANINTLFKFHKMSNVFIFLIMGDSATFLLRPGETIMHVNFPMRGEWCSLVPIGGPCHSITTKGLLYNMTNRKLEFGQSISTSNGFGESREVTIKASNTILWSVELKLGIGLTNHIN